MRGKIDLAERERDLPPVLIGGVAVLIVAAVVALFLYAGRLDPHARIFGRTAGLGRERVIDDLSLLLGETAPAVLRGRIVSLEDVRVESVPGDSLFWVGAAAGRVPVLLLGERTQRQSEDQVELAAGDRIALFGTVRTLEPARLFARARLLSERERSALRRAPLFISALRVVPRM